MSPSHNLFNDQGVVEREVLGFFFKQIATILIGQGLFCNNALIENSVPIVYKLKLCTEAETCVTEYPIAGSTMQCGSQESHHRDRWVGSFYGKIHLKLSK